MPGMTKSWRRRLLADRRYTCIAVFACALPVLLSAAAIADDYPSRPVTIVVPFTAGGRKEQLARGIAPGFRRRSIRATLVENGEDDAS
jgi:tripartite-type tricarboxylate transporter receptor subunit TctC